MSQYVFLQVKEVIRETADAVTVVFTKPTVITTYKSGQFLTLILTIGGEKLRRSYSLSSSPYADEDWAVSVKKIQGGKMSTYIVDHLKAGDIIETMAPIGIFVYEPVASNTNDIVLIGGGSGITPLVSVISSALKVEQKSKVYLIYSNRNENSVMLKEKLEKLKSDYSERFTYVTIFSKPTQPTSGISGRLDKTKVVQLLENFKFINFNKAHFFVCGPSGMMDEAFQALDKFKVPKDNVRKENFTAAVHHHSEEAPVETAAAITGGPVVVDIKYGKQTYKVNVASGQTILEAALNQNIDLPYSCQSGMCTACMGKCKSGKVKMDDPDGLSENEIKQGFILICVGKPMTADILIEID
ncbi:MAG TPA: ferredoxin--NADP reductase [Cytophagaceae bacterium]|nr:ferredoxin--NADP reductase [Cytophagaceae bacterium]